MPLHWYFHDPDGNYTEITEGVPTGDTAVSSMADEGQAGMSTLPIDDRDLNLTMRGHRLIWAGVDGITSTGSNAAGEIVWAGYTRDREIVRGDAPLERELSVQLVDGNSLLDREAFTDTGAMRSAETDVERMTWLLSTDEMDGIEDTVHFSTASPVDMSEADYRKQKPSDVIRDCMDQSGKNCWIGYVANASNSGPRFFIWYGHDDLTTWDSGIRLTNDLADVDSSTTFAVAYDTTVKYDPERVVSKVIVEYDGGWVEVERAATATRFAARTGVLQAPNIRSRTVATARGRRFLRQVASEEITVTTSIIVTPAQANIIREGQLVELKLTHVSDFTSYTSMRVLNRTFREVEPDVYEIAMELTPPSSDTAGGGAVYGILWQPHNGWLADYNHIVWYGDGDAADHPPGYPDRPTTGLIAPTINSSLPNGRDHVGWTINGTGTVNVNFTASWVGVAYGSHTVIWEIKKNGATVASATKAISVGGLTGYVDINTVSVNNLAVTNGDELTAHVSASPGPFFFTVPAGVGDFDHQFEISGGSLS